MNFIISYKTSDGNFRKRVATSLEEAKAVAEKLGCNDIRVRGVNVLEAEIPAENTKTWEDKNWEEIKKEIKGKTLFQGIDILLENMWYSNMFFNIQEEKINNKFFFPIAVNIDKKESIAFKVNGCCNQVVNGEWVVINCDEIGENEIVNNAIRCARRGITLGEVVKNINEFISRDFKPGYEIETKIIETIKNGVKQYTCFDNVANYLIDLRYNADILKYISSSKEATYSLFIKEKGYGEGYFSMSSKVNTMFSTEVASYKNKDIDFIEVSTVFLRMTVYNRNGKVEIEVNGDIK